MPLNVRRNAMLNQERALRPHMVSMSTHAHCVEVGCLKWTSPISHAQSHSYADSPCTDVGDVSLSQTYHVKIISVQRLLQKGRHLQVAMRTTRDRA